MKRCIHCLQGTSFILYSLLTTSARDVVYQLFLGLCQRDRATCKTPLLIQIRVAPCYANWRESLESGVTQQAKLLIVVFEQAIVANNSTNERSTLRVGNEPNEDN